MRSPARILKKIYQLYKLNPRRRELENEISAALGREIRLHAKPTKSRDRSSIYWAKNDGRNVGILRLLNPYFEPGPIPPNDSSPRYLLPMKYRLAHEWDAYSLLHPIGLSPEPIWHCKDATMGSHVDWPRVSNQLIANPDRFWRIMERVIPTLRSMHDLGIFHMDLNMGNILADEDGDGIMFIDFEYAGAVGLTPPQQKAFDYLQMISNTTRRRRGGDVLRADTDRMASLLDASIDTDTRNADLVFATNTLAKIDAIPGLHDSLKSVFTNL